MNRHCPRCFYQLTGDDEHPTVDACLQILVKENARLYDWIGKLSRQVSALDSRTTGSIRFGTTNDTKVRPMSDGLEWTKDATKEQVIEVLRQKEAVIKTLESDDLLRVSRNGFEMLTAPTVRTMRHVRPVGKGEDSAG